MRESIALSAFFKVDAHCHCIVGAELSMVSVSDGEALTDLIRPLCRNLDRVIGSGV
ncbi:hypothetical protein [Pseudoalteromonas sp. MSK9-3]|uniref:hypothetical protein n=1 Tax=Pseudoalteromonas sp. MSK9-3 TaxID=1897633 RepID=UPI0016005AA9|nr:hypothetical protein [Pseudoalteromonas sp. MSK9-3]